MIPFSFAQGDSLTWTEENSDYKASDGYTLNYSLVNSDNSYTITSSASGDDHVFTLATTDTSSYKSGKYNYQRYVTKASEKITLDYGSLTIIKDYSVAHDARSHAKKTLSAIEAVIENRATVDQLAYTINGRSLSRTPLEELIKFRSFYQGEVAREDREERLAQGLGTRQNIRVRLHN